MQLWKILTTLNKYHSGYVGSNLTLTQERICSDIRNIQTQRAWLSEKKMGPVWCATELYTNWGVLDHNGNNTTYKLLTENIAKSWMVKLKYAYEIFITRNCLEVSYADQTYLWRSLKKCDKKISRFYLTVKMHKTLRKTRPVASTSRKMMSGISKWLDHWMQKLRHKVPTYLKDSSHLIQLLTDQGTLPPGAKLFTTDSKSMYTNIDTDHETGQVEEWIEEYHKELPVNFPTKAVKEDLKLVMHNKIFEFGDCFFEQLSVCAITTLYACIYTTIYYTYLERKKLLPKY